MGVPKRKTSKMRLRTRKASHRWRAPQLNKCPQCGSTVASHTACPSCGYYKGRQVLTVEARLTVAEGHRARESALPRVTGSIADTKVPPTFNLILHSPR